MAKTWGELSQHPDFQSLSREEQEAVRGRYFDKYIAPQVAPEILGKARSMYDEKTLAKPDSGFVSDLGESALVGVKDLGARAMSAWDTLMGNGEAVVKTAAEQQQAEYDKPGSGRAYNAAFERNKKANGEDTLVNAAKTWGQSVWEHPTGALQKDVVEQLPTMGVVMGSGLAGAKAGAALGGVLLAPTGPGAGAGAILGGIVGGLLGMFAGNAAIEVGDKALQKAADGDFAEREQNAAIGEGLTKAGVVTAVDGFTLGLSKMLLGAPRKVVEQAAVKVLARNGVDLTDEAALVAARANPKIAAEMLDEGQKAYTSVMGNGKGAARYGTAALAETAGEGVGEYGGELAATGEASITDAFRESLSSAPMSAAEILFAKKLDAPGQQTTGVVDATGVPITDRAAVDAYMRGVPPAGPADPTVAPEDSTAPDVANVPPEPSFAGLPKELQQQALQNVAAGKPWDAGLGISDAEVVTPLAETPGYSSEIAGVNVPAPTPIPVVGPLSAAANAGQQASAAGISSTPAPTAEQQAAQQQAQVKQETAAAKDQAALQSAQLKLQQQQQEAAAKQAQQQQDAALKQQQAALKLKQEQLKINQSEQKLGMGPTQFDEPALLGQANDLAALSQPTIDQPTPENADGLQTQTDAQVPSQVPSQAPNAAPVPAPAGEVALTAAQAPAAATGQTSAPGVERADGQTAVVPDTGMRLVHGSGNPNLTANDIEIVRTTGQKQGKKGRTYGGLYGTSETDAAQAEGYAQMMGGQATLYDINVKPGTKVLHKEGDITRLSKPYIEELTSQGYGLVVGKDPRGRTEYAVIDKGAIHSLTPRGATSAPATAPGVAPLSNTTAPAEEQAHVEAFNRVNAKNDAESGTKTPLPRVRAATEADLSPAVRDSRGMVSALAARFGHRVIYVAPEDPKAKLTFDGSISPNDPTTIILAADSAMPASRVMVHEMFHGLKRVAPEIYDKLIKSLRRTYDPKKVAKHANQRGYEGDLTEANEEEWAGDFFSNAVHTPKVMAQIALEMDREEAGAGLKFLRELKTFFQRILDQLLGEGYTGADKAVKDLETAHAAVVKAISEYARARLTGKTAESLAEAPLSARLTEEEKAARAEDKTKAAAARAKAKNPPLETGNEVTDIYARTTVSARAPTSPGAKENPVTHDLGLDLNTYLKAPSLLPKVVATLSTYPQLRPAKGEATDAQRLRAFIEVMRANLLWLHDQVDPEIRKRSKLWYDGALKITERAAARYGVTKRQFAAVLATQSPQKDWFENVSLGERITAIFKRYQNHAWDAKMDAASERVLKQEELAELADDLNEETSGVDATPSKFLETTARAIVAKSQGKVPYPRALEIAKEAQAKKNAVNRERLDRVRGKRLAELYDDLDAAIWVRVFDAAHHSPHYHTVSPEGNFVGIRQGALGPARIRWGTFAAVAKSISVLKDGTIENISTQLGKEHKIRNFYNNIIVPNDPRGYVTMDTHAIAADMVSPFSGYSIPVSHNFGSRGAPGSTVYGISGTYPIHGEGYTRAAKARELLPREMQSITWEAIRGVFPAQFKRKPNIDHINALWQDYNEGKTTLEKTREAILDYVIEKTGRTKEQIFTPEWARSPAESLSEVSYEDKPGMPPVSTAQHRAGSGMNAEVAPNPDLLKGAAKGAAAKWGELTAEERSKVTEVVGQPIIKRVMAKLGIKQYRPEFTVGGYETDANPSITIHFGDAVSWEQLEEATRVIGYLWKQKEMVMFDETDKTGEGQTSYIRVEPTRKLSTEELSDLYVQVHAAFPDANGMSVSDGAPVFANFSDLTDADFEQGLQAATHSYLADKDYSVKLVAYRFRSALIGDVVGQVKKTGEDIVQTTLRGTRYDEETQTTGTGGKDGWRNIGKAGWTGGETLRWQGDFDAIQTSFDQRFQREVGHAYRRVVKQRNAAPLSLRPDAARDERAGAGPAAQGRPSYGTARPGAVKSTGVHYSQAERQTLDSTKYGTGIKGEEGRRVAAAKDKRLQQRVYFYVSTGTGVRPEPGVGGYTHTVDLNNLYDLDADPQYLYRPDLATNDERMNAFESAVIDAGFDGYVADFAGQRAAVLLGAHQVPVQYEGLAKRPQVPAGERATPNPLKQVAALLRTPWMRQTPKAFGDKLKAADPDLYRQFADQFTATDQTYWPGDMVKQLRPVDTVNATPTDVASWSRAAPLSLRTKPAPKKTVKAYKLFRLDPKRPGEIFPLFVKMGENAGVPLGAWQDAEEGAPAAKTGKVASSIGPLAYRPGWHAGDLPIATHIGGERDSASGKPTVRPANQVWAEVEMGADVDWQAEANIRGKTARDKAITDQIPVDGFYRYKTNPNMTGNWLIGGTMKVNRLLSDAEVQQVNDAAGVADLPRKTPLDLQKFGFDEPRLVFSNRPTVQEENLAKREYGAVIRKFTNSDGSRKPGWLKAPNGMPTLVVDGVERSTTNSLGDPLHPTEVGVRNFWRWFAPSPSSLLEGLPVSVVRRLKRNTKLLADFLEGQSGLPKSDRFSEIPDSMLAHVAGAVNEDKVREVVIRSLPVEVVNFLSRKQRSPEVVLQDAAMLKEMFAVNPTSNVALDVNPALIAELLVRVVANAGAKISGATSRSLENNAAVLADTTDPVLGTHVSNSPSSDLGIIAGFDGSKVVDAEGRPRVVYHGTGTRFNKVNLKKGAQGLFWFTSDKAEIEAGEVGAAGKGVVMALYAKIDNPADWQQYDRLGLYEYQAKGLDGALLPEANGEVDGFVIDRPTQIKSANTNRGTFDPDNADIRFSNRPTPEPPPAETRFRKAQRVVQDKFNRFKVVQDWLKTQGVPLSEAGDVYRAEERFHARVANQIEDFREQTLKPLVAKSQKAGFKMADIAQFLHAQHAEERNDAIAKINPKFPDGGSGMATAEARAILAAASPELKQIAAEWRQLADDSLELKLQAGLITQEQADAFRAKYAYYVPLRGGPEEQLMVGTGKGLKVRHKEQRALGHPVREGGEWIIEQLLADRESAIMKAEKALIAKHVLQMAVEMQRPDIISVEQPKQRQVLKDKVSYVVTYKGSPIEAFQSLEAARVFRQMAGTQKGNHLIDFDIIKSSDPQVVLMASPRLGDNELMAYVGGHEIRIQINDDLLSRAYGNLGQDALGPILRAGRVLNTWLSKVYTGYNPEFILVNLMRDFTTGIANLSGEQGAMMAMRAVKRYPKAFRDLLRYARNPARATQSIRDYREDGGNTGAAYLDDLERIGTDVAAEYAKLQGVIGNLRERNARGAASSAIGNTLKPLVSWIEKLNQAGENAMRLAIYQAMRDSGKGRVAAASAAKNTTVNFNRKGELGLALNAWWLFFNAAVQGTSSIAHAHFKGAHKGQAWAFSSGLIGTMYLASLLAAGDDEDDDEYEKISEYDRSRNLIIRTKDGFVKLPIPYGYGFFANLGRGLADAQRTGEVGKLPWHLATSFIEEYTPFGAMVAGKQPDWQQVMTFMGPTAWQIGAVPAYNRTSFGTPLYPTQAFKTEEFARDRMWRGTKGTWADELAGALETAGMDVSPETLKHLWRTGTGGAGTFVTGLLDAGQLKVRGADYLDAREVPLLRKFVSVPGVQEARARYYEAVEESKIAKETFARFKKQGRFEEMETYQVENEALISMAAIAEKTSKRIKKARDLYDAVKLDETLPLPEKRRQLREMEVEETQIYDDFVRMFQERTRVAPR